MRRVLLVSAAMAALSLLIWAAPAAAFPLTNCTLQAASLKADGSALDSIASGANDATQEDPFIVDWDGTITYQGQADIEMKNNTWSVSVFNIRPRCRAAMTTPRTIDRAAARSASARTRRSGSPACTTSRAR